MPDIIHISYSDVIQEVLNSLDNNLFNIVVKLELYVLSISSILIKLVQTNMALVWKVTKLIKMWKIISKYCIISG